MNGFEKMKLRTSISGNSIRNEKILDSRFILSQANENDPSYCDTFFRWDSKNTHQIGDRIHPRFYNRKASYGKIEQKIQTLYEEKINMGDLFINTKDNSYWMCVEIFDMNEISWNGKLEQCNYTLKFQHPKTGEILSYPCIDKTTNTVGIDENKVITTGSSVHTIKLPFDGVTKTIRKDKRFFIDRCENTTYKVTNVNNTEFVYDDVGVLALTLKEDSSYNPQTDVNGVCEYFSPTVAPTSNPNTTKNTYSLLKTSGDLLIGGKFRTLTAVCYNSDNTINNDININWTFTYPTDYDSLFTVTYPSNRTATIICEDTNDYNELIGKFVAIEVADDNGGFIGKMELKIKI